MQCCSFDDASAPGVKDAAPSLAPSVVGDAQAFTDATGPRYVGLQDFDIASLYQPLEIGERRLLLSAGNRRRDGGGERGVLRVIVRPKGLLDPIGSVLLHPLRPVDTVTSALPALSNVDHQIEIVPSSL